MNIHRQAMLTYPLFSVKVQAGCAVDEVLVPPLLHYDWMAGLKVTASVLRFTQSWTFHWDCFKNVFNLKLKMSFGPFLDHVQTIAKTHPPLVTVAMSDMPLSLHTSCSHTVKNTSRSKDETNNMLTDKINKTDQVTSGMKQGLSFQIVSFF